jgi:hypothetical protein
MQHQPQKINTRFEWSQRLHCSQSHMMFFAQSSALFSLALPVDKKKQGRETALGRKVNQMMRPSLNVAAGTELSFQMIHNCRRGSEKQSNVATSSGLLERIFYRKLLRVTSDYAILFNIVLNEILLVAQIRVVQMDVLRVVVSQLVRRPSAASRNNYLTSAPWGEASLTSDDS